MARPSFRVHEARRYLLLALGSLLAAVSLKLFLVPNRIIDGGVVGIAIMASSLTGLPLGLYLFLLNLPFLQVGYRHIGRTFAISTLFAVALLSGLVTLLSRGAGPLTDDPLLAAVFGGLILGAGVGLVIRNGGSLDGTESVAILLARRFGFSVGEVVMFFNFFILGSAGLLFSWDRAMYSLLAYYVAFRTIDLVIVGLNESRAVTVVTGRPAAVAGAIVARLGRSVTRWDGTGGYSGGPMGVILCIVTRLEVPRLKAVVAEEDPLSFMSVQNVHEALGGRLHRQQAP
jgi:uncharacterized membrane-anchored protein YitT (DUF2179 family)